MRRILLVSLTALLLFGCAASRFAKKAAEFETAGLYKDAAEFYYKSVLKKQTKVETKLGLQRTGQFVLNDLLNEFNRHYENNENQNAVYKYLEAKEFADKLNGVNVALNFPDMYHTRYNEMKDNYISERYIEGSEKLSREEFAAAAEIFGEIINIQADYKNVKELHIQAVYEPVYRSATRNMELSKYRTAYWLFKRILNEAGGYKNALELMTESQKLARINIIIPDIRYGRRGSKITMQQVVNAINNTGNPFLTVMDKSVVDDKQLYKLNGEFNLPALNLLGFGAILKVEVVNVDMVDGKLNMEERPAYLKETIKYTDEQGQEKKRDVYHKIYYKAYSKTNKSSVTFSYALIDTRTGAILLSDSYTTSRKETVEFGRYEGGLKNVVAGYWAHIDKKSPEDKVNDSNYENRKLHQFLTANDKITTTEGLLEEASEEALKRMAYAIDEYNPEN